MSPIYLLTCWICLIYSIQCLPGNLHPFTDSVNHDLSPPCYECTLNNVNQSGLINYHSNDVCPLPCICHADEKPNCSPGVSIIRDGCDCCWICARQSGEGCSLRFKCDSVDNLDCYYETVLDVTTAAVVRESLTSGVRKKLTLIPPEADAVGTCWKVSGRPCYVNGTWLAHSGVQKTGCRHQCVCVDGTLVCTDLCAEVEQNRPSESVCSQVVDDRSATFQLQLMPPAEGECCRRWMCIAGINEDPLSNEGLRVVDTTVDHSFFSRTYDACKQVRRVTVNWSLCSQQCGLGLSTRWTTDTVDCRNITQVRLCFWRPCQTIKLASTRSFVPTLKFVRPGYLKFTTPYGDPNNLLPRDPSNGRQTESTDTESVQKDSLTMCQLERAIRPRFCNRPTNPTEACCWPSQVKTKRLRFHCTGGIEVYHFFEWIQLCRCVRAPCEHLLHSSDWHPDSVFGKV